MITRKAFLVQLAGGGWVLSGCGGGGSGYGAPAPAPAPVPAACSATLISSNHGHVLAIPVADLSSTVAMSYDILGTASHTHQVTFTAAQLAQLKSGAAITVTSTVNLAHSHDLTEACV